MQAVNIQSANLSHKIAGITGVAIPNLPVEPTYLHQREFGDFAPAFKIRSPTISDTSRTGLASKFAQRPVVEILACRNRSLTMNPETPACEA
jgi:hypothetical protein